MIICSCHGVTDNQLRAACQAAGDPSACPAGSGCGGCLATITAIVDEVQRAGRLPSAESPARSPRPAEASRRDAG